MNSITDAKFIIKHNYHKTIEQYSIVRIITFINECCLVEDIKTLKRLWLMKYELYPTSNEYSYGCWEINKEQEELYKSMGLK
jgi:hypothetical protein